MVTKTRISVEEFDAFVAEEYSDTIYEFIAGEVVEVPTNPYASMIAGRIFGFLFIFLLKNKIGWATVPDGGFQIMGERYAPDVAFMRYSKQAEPTKQGYNPIPPDLAVEVVSTESNAENTKLTIKVANYLNAGVLVWVVRPDSKTVEIYAQGQPVRVLSDDAVINGGDLLPNFELALRDIFEAESENSD